MSNHRVTDKNCYLRRLKRVLTMHAGLVVSYEDFERRVFAEQFGCHQYLTVLVSQLRKDGWQIECYPRIGYKLLDAGAGKR